jgi:hypothetical protein
MKRHLSKKATILSTLLVSMMGGAAYDAFATQGLGALDALPKELHGEIGKYHSSLQALEKTTIYASKLNEANIDTFKLLVNMIVKLDRSDEKTLKLVGQLTNLKKIFTDQSVVSGITDASLAYLLKDMKNLEVLYIGNTLVTDAGLVHLKDLKNLIGLSLVNTGVTDAGLTHLKDLINLQDINLENTKVTDKALIYLKGFKKLKYIMIDNTKITDAGAAELRKSFPNAEIYHSYRP